MLRLALRSGLWRRNIIGPCGRQLAAWTEPGTLPAGLVGAFLERLSERSRLREAANRPAPATVQYVGRGRVSRLAGRLLDGVTRASATLTPEFAMQAGLGMADAQQEAEWIPVEEALGRTGLSRRTLDRRVEAGHVRVRRSPLNRRRREYLAGDLQRLPDLEIGAGAHSGSRRRGRPPRAASRVERAATVPPSDPRRMVAQEALATLVRRLELTLAVSASTLVPKGVAAKAGEPRIMTTLLPLSDHQVRTTPFWALAIGIFGAVWGDRDPLPAPDDLRKEVTSAVDVIFGYQSHRFGVPEAFWRDTIVGREFARALLMTFRADELVGLSQAAEQLGWRWPRLREALAQGVAATLYDPDQARLLLPPESLAALRQSRFMVEGQDLAPTVTIEERETGTVRSFDRRSGKTTLRGGEEGRIQNLVRRSRYLQLHGLDDSG
jgi:hypothetical protein